MHKALLNFLQFHLKQIFDINGISEDIWKDGKAKKKDLDSSNQYPTQKTSINLFKALEDAQKVFKKFLK